MRKINKIIIMLILSVTMALILSSCSKTNELDPCYLIEQDIERQVELIDRMEELRQDPNTPSHIWNELNVRLLDARSTLSEMRAERNQVCG